MVVVVMDVVDDVKVNPVTVMRVFQSVSITSEWNSRKNLCYLFIISMFSFVASVD
jgi:hypothetical protein